VGPKLEEAFARKGIASVGHLLYHLPRGYQDRRDVQQVADLRAGERGLACVEVLGTQEITIRKTRRKMFRVSVGDASGKMALTFFRTWPGLSKRFPVGKRFFVWGDVKAFGGTKQIAHPELEEADELGAGRSQSVGRIVPVYRGMDEVGQGRVRDLVQQALQRHAAELPEILPADLVRERELPTAGEALRRIHFPSESADIEALSEGASPWHRRMAYEELFLLSAGLALKARGIQVEPGHAFDVSPERLQRALSVLPFSPTGAQRRAIEAIASDMGRPEPMNRLLQGDVGSGKTAVALAACLLAVFDGRQAALLAPTEILAEQHHRSFTSLLEGSGVEVALLVAGRGAKAANEARERMASGLAQIAVGTHALLSATSAFESLGLVVIDEQHRFGVEQRAELIGKGRRPDVLVMTATPIPRTLSLVLHGELTQTVIDELPPGRTPVHTQVIPAKDRERAHRVLEEELAKGRQAYVVHPLIEESEHSDLEDATQGLLRLQKRLPGRRLALLHGRMKADERDEVMAAFRAGEVDVLVSTTVVEVGVDVPNATVMVVENAERFGLSQLHQLRGRVGRGAARSVCLLIDHGDGEGKAATRLATMERTNDGFAIAQADLEIRGPGEFLGTRQAGLPELAHADLARDARLLEQARSDAFTLVARDPTLGAAEHLLLRAEVWERFAERMSLARVG
jgi:ATP-dependent DNA helicase RecG